MRDHRPILVPVLPGGRRGIENAATRSLLELKRHHEAVVADPTTEPALRDHSRRVLVEVVRELRRRNRQKAVAA